MEHCPNCGGELKIIATIREQPVIGKIFTHFRLQTRAHPRPSARDQALQTARRHPTGTVQAPRQLGSLESTKTEGSRGPMAAV
jgi:hypothetical protein